MNKKILPLLVLALGVSVLGISQSKDKAPAKKEKESDLIIRKKSGSKDKMTIVIDGNDITVNGKPLDQLKESDVEILHERGIGSMLPRLKSQMAPFGSLKMLADIESNSAYLGVTSNASDKGAKIVSVQKESPAEKAGFKKDDIITKVNDTKIENSGDLYEAIGDFKPEEKVNITYLRDDKEATASVILEKNKSAEARSFNFKNGDFNNDFNGDFNLKMPELRNLPRINGMDFGGSFSRKPRLGVEIQDVEEGKGVKILDVDDDTPAAKAGLKKDDVISELNGKSINSVDELQSALRELKEGDSFKIGFKRNGQSQTAEIKFPKKLKTAEL
jgi:serine protease Do